MPAHIYCLTCSKSYLLTLVSTFSFDEFKRTNSFGMRKSRTFLFYLTGHGMLPRYVQRRREWVGRGHVPPSVGNSENFRKIQNFISTAHVHDDVM